MQKLVALRRPTAHYRKVDGPRLMEAMCVMDRLDRRMKQDGGWKAALESDE